MHPKVISDINTVPIAKKATANQYLIGFEASVIRSLVERSV